MYPAVFCCILAGKATTIKNQEYTQQEYFPVHVLCLGIVDGLWPTESINYRRSDFLTTDCLIFTVIGLILTVIHILNLKLIVIIVNYENERN